MRTTTDHEQLIERFLPPAWRLAIVSTDDLTAAQEATVVGFVDGVTAAERDGIDAIGTEIVAATRRAVLAKGVAADARPLQGDSPVVGAFHGLKEKARAAVWLTEVEGGRPEEVAPVLGLDPEAAAVVCERASARFRSDLADGLAAGASNEDCRSALSRLDLHANGQLPDDERREVSSHIAACNGCSVLLAMVVSPRPLLRGLAVEIPDTLAPAVAERLAARHHDARRGVLLHPVTRQPVTRRAVGAAAAALLAITAGAAALAGGGDGDDAPELAAPAAVELDTGASPAAGGLRLPTPAGSSVAASTISSSRPRGTTGSTPIRAVDRVRSLGSTPSAPPPSDPPASSTTPTTTPGLPPTAPPPPGTPPLVPGLPVPGIPGVPPLPIPALPVPELPALPGLPPGPAAPTCTGVALLDSLLGCAG